METDFATPFAAGLLDPQRANPEHTVASHGRSVARRYNVYRNNVTVSLIDALASIYPAVQRITGVDFFRAMARFHIRATPPTSPLLFEYGRDFPAFIEAYPYAQEMPWLADTARIERAWLDAYHAADAQALTAQDLAAVPAAALPCLRLTPHPATRMVRSAHAAVSIFAMNRRDEPVTPVDTDVPEIALVTRPEQEVVVSLLPAQADVFLDALLRGCPLGEAATAAFEAAPDFDLSGHLAALVAAGVFTSPTGD